MRASDMLSSDQLSILKGIAQQYNTDYNLILAIGQHETGWGSLGDGRNDMYTGYGSYDSGSDYTKAGFEQQVAGTASKMAAWGITPDGVSLTKLQAGNSGLLPTGIYATDRTWPAKVYAIYKSIVDDTGDIAAADMSGIVSSSGSGSASSSGLLPGSGTTKKYLFLGVCGLFTVFIFAGVMK